MIEHMVWIKFHPGVTDESVRQHLDALAGLASTVKAVQELHVGPNVTDRAQGFTHGLLVRVRDREALQAYLDDPRHVEVAGALKAEADLLAMDVEHD